MVRTHLIISPLNRRIFPLRSSIRLRNLLRICTSSDSNKCDIFPDFPTFFGLTINNNFFFKQSIANCFPTYPASHKHLVVLDNWSFSNVGVSNFESCVLAVPIWTAWVILFVSQITVPFLPRSVELCPTFWLPFIDLTVKVSVIRRHSAGLIMDDMILW